jgi:uncharacterized protein (DUF983 family)
MDRPLITHFDNPTSLQAGVAVPLPALRRGQAVQCGFLRLAKRCDRCDLDLAFADPADGPAFFVMTGVGIVVIAVWAWAVIAWNPPLWVQFATVFPALLVGCLGTLRPVKAWLVAEQYIHKASEGGASSVQKR